MESLVKIPSTAQGSRDICTPGSLNSIAHSSMHAGRLFKRFLRLRKHTYAPFEDLPDEILLLILEQLDKRELCHVARLCKRLYSIALEPLLSGVEVIVGWGQHGPGSVPAPSWTADEMLGLTILPFGPLEIVLQQ